LWSVATGTQFGYFALARLAVAVLLLAAAATPRLRVALALVLLLLVAPAGHAGAQPGPAGDVHLAADAIHLVAAGAWLGGLPALAMLLHRAAQTPQALSTIAVRTTARFSLLGMACVALLILSGVANSWFLLSGPGDLIDSAYGRVLSAKLALFAAMLTIAAVNRFHLTPRLAAPAALRALRRNSLAECAIGAAVLFLVAILGTEEPAAHHHSSTSIPDDAAFVHIHTNIVMADVTVTPGRPGNAEILIHLANEDFTDYAARAVHIELRPPQPAVPVISRDAKPVGEATWSTAGIVLPRPGIWTVVLRITPSAGAIVNLDGPIVITLQ
jgi:putative copper resistance protein D